MVRIIFEDNGDTPSSILLKSSPIGRYVKFSCGNFNLFPFVKEALQDFEIDQIIIYCDFVLNSERLFLFYKRLRQEIIEEMQILNSDKSVYLIPIPCIEYYILLYLIEFKIDCFSILQLEKISSFVQDFKIDLSDIHIWKENFMVSVEKICKYYLNSNSNKCIINKNRNNQVVGKFYKSDCNCREDLCKIGCTKDLLQKAFEFYSILPTLYSENKMETTLKIKNIYEKMARNLELANYNFRSLELKKEDIV